MDNAHNKESATIWNLEPEWWCISDSRGEVPGKGNLW